jgi:hypothetical protein
VNEVAAPALRAEVLIQELLSSSRHVLTQYIHALIFHLRIFFTRDFGII